MRSRVAAATLALLVATAAGGEAQQVEVPMPPAADDHAHHAPAPSELSKEQEYFTDVELINQDGEPMRFYSDLLQGKTVVINPFFTTCTGVCPVMSQKIAAIQEWLGDRLGKDVHLISLSVDPETDTVPRLKAYAESWGARKGWYFLSGDKANVDWALYRVGQYTDNKEAHTNVMVIGNEPAKVWRKTFGLAKTSDIIAVLEHTLDESGAPAP